MGHVHGTNWVYQHPDLHEEDFISLNHSEIAIEERVKAEFDARSRRLPEVP